MNMIKENEENLEKIVKWFEKRNIPINLSSIKEEDDDDKEGVSPRPSEKEIEERRKKHSEMTRDKRKYVKMELDDLTDTSERELLKDRIGALQLKIDASKKWFKSYNINITG